MDNTTVVQVQEVEVIIVPAFVPCCKSLVSGSKAKGKALDEAAELFLAITDFNEQLNALKMLARAYQRGQEIEGLAVSKYKSALGYIRTQMANRNPNFKLLSQNPEAVEKREQREVLALIDGAMGGNATNDETKDKTLKVKTKIVAGQKNFLHELEDSLKTFVEGGCSRNPEGFRQIVSSFMVSAIQNETNIEKTN